MVRFIEQPSQIENVEGLAGSDTAGSRLLAEREEISKRWEERARRELPAPDGHPGLALVTSVSDIVAEVARRLSSGELTPVARSNLALRGLHKVWQEGHEIEQVIREYEILRASILGQLKEDGLLSRPVEDALSEAMHAFMRDAASGFALRREEEFREITRRVEMEKRLYDTITETLDEQVFVLDQELRFRYVNHAASKTIGRSAQEVIGRTPRELRMPLAIIERLEPELRKALTGTKLCGDVDAPLAGGTRRIEYRLTPIYEEDGRISAVVGIGHDVHERAMLVEQLRLERARRGQFAAAVAHDLQSPLAAARASAEMLLQGKPNSEREHRLVVRIRTTIDRVSRMVKNLLDAMHLEAKQALSVQLGPSNLQEVIEDAVEEMATLHPGRFKVVLHGNMRGVWSYEDLRRVVENLLSNAVKYGTPKSKITVSADGSQPDAVQLRVHNLGPPIPSDQAARLFTPYGRTMQAVESGKHGWGIGLALTQALVEAHRGRIRFESNDEGTTFIVDLPRDAHRP